MALAVVADPAHHARWREDALGLVGTDVASGGAGLAGKLVDGPLVLRRRHGDLPVTPRNSYMSERNIALCYRPRPDTWWHFIVFPYLSGQHARATRTSPDPPAACQLGAPP